MFFLVLTDGLDVIRSTNASATPLRVLSRCQVLEEKTRRLAWMDKGKTPDHLIWRDAVEDLVRQTEELATLIQRMHHRYFAQHVKQALLRITNA